MTKTMILGIVIAGIIGAGITAAYAGMPTISLKGTIDADGNPITNVGKATDTSDAVNLGTLNDALDSGVPTSGPELDKKWILFKNATGKYVRLLDEHLGEIDTQEIPALFGEIVDTVLDGDDLIVTIDSISGVTVVRYNGTTGELNGANGIEGDAEFIKQIDKAKTTTRSLQKVSMTPMNVLPGNTASANVDCPSGTEVVSYSAYANDSSTGDRLFFEDGISVFPDQYSDASGTGVRFTVDNSGGSVEVVANATTVCGNLPEAP